MSNDPVRHPGGEGRPDSGMRARVRTRIALRYRGHDLPLGKSEVLLGRGADCDVMLASALVSRHHAKLWLGEHEIRIEDLGSRNGVFVNGEPIAGVRTLQVGDRIDLGDEELELVHHVVADHRGRETQTQMRAQLPESEPPESEERTRQASAFVLLGSLLDKLLALGRAEEAERLMSTHLERVLAEAERGVRPEALSTAGEYSVRLADATGKARWVDFVIRLYAAMREPLPTPQVDALHAVVRKVRGADVAALRRYVDVLRERAAELTAAERFALRRIESLVDVAAL